MSKILDKSLRRFAPGRDGGVDLADNIKEIHGRFSDYMETDKNIYTLIKMDDFLTDSEKIHILKKYYKLWIPSTNLLQDISTNDIFIDIEAMISDMENKLNILFKLMPTMNL